MRLQGQQLLITCCWMFLSCARSFLTSSNRVVVRSKGLQKYHTSTMAPRAVRGEETSAAEPKISRKRSAKAAASPKAAKAKTASKSPPASSPEPSPPSKDKKAASKKPPAHQVLTERDEIPKLWDSEKAKANGSYTFRIASWNVAGIRAVLKKTPDCFSQLAAKHDLDILCLQETKLQEQHLDDPKLKIRESVLADDYDGYWTCSTAKKGYAGTAVFVRKQRTSNGNKTKKGGGKQTTMDGFLATDKAKSNATAAAAAPAKHSTKPPLPIDPQLLVPERVSYKMNVEKHDSEGRLVVVDMPLFSFCNVYVPNSGQKLERLAYRTDEWDKDLLAFMQEKQQKDGRPVIWLGDLNVAHTNLEVWNDGAKHLPKQAGVTPEERASFQAQLDAGFVDAFRRLHPTAAGHYSYWSNRAGNRAPNKGLRLDYFVCDPTLFDEQNQVVVRDSYMDFDQMGSDHCPVILELEIKKKAAK